MTPTASLTKPNFIFRRETLLFALLGVIVAFVLTRWTVAQPNYTDAYYHFNAATRLVSGQGLTDAYLWNYINAPQSLAPGEVVPSHTYWMPLTSLSAALGMWLLNAPGNYAAAQWPFALMLAATTVSGFWLGHRLGGTRRHTWVAGLVTLFSGFFTRFWGASDTFASYAIAGALSLIFIGLGVQALHMRQHQRMYLWFALAGVAAGFGHLARADGLLLLLVGGIVILWPWDVRRNPLIGLRVGAVMMLLTGYVLVMLPWFVRNLNAVGSPLPIGGFQAAWFTEYNDLFSYPADASPATLFANGLGAFLESRWSALTNNVGTLVAVEGLIVMTPFMLLSLWKRRQDSFLRGFWLYALGLHVAMTLVFPFPGY
ncbi:MAG: hypothetical protein SF029_05020, partial [bacterium]|nr:hypothetical protein [bacterium]